MLRRYNNPGSFLRILTALFIIIVGATIVLAGAGSTPSASAAAPSRAQRPSMGAASVSDQPIIPRIDATLKARLRTIFAAGQTQGNRAAVFAKIGDSISESGSFLQDIGCSAEELGSYNSLAATITYFRATTFPAGSTGVWCGIGNSFSRASAAAVAGWSADYALAPLGDPVAGCDAPYNTALQCELHLLHPSIALIMYGTNDLQRYNDLDMYRANLTAIVSQTIAAGVIPVLSTIPPRLDEADFGARVAPYNQVVLEVAAAQQVPLWNFWRALQGADMVNAGIDADGVHPNVYQCPPCLAADFSATALHYGYNQRNLTAVQTLEKLKRVIIDNGAPDSGAPEPSPTATVTSGATSSTPTLSATRTNTAAPTATPTTATCGSNFGDVSATDFFYAGVHYLVDMGAISGYADCTFKPYNNTTRGQLAKIVVLAERFAITTPSSPTFSDVSTGNPFYRFIETAAARGIVSGYANGTFNWAGEVTRGQLAKIVVLAAGWPLLNPTTPSFGDVPQSNPFYRPIETAVSRGIIGGYDSPAGRIFRAANSATRGQIAKIVHLAVTAAPDSPTATASATATATVAAAGAINVATSGDDSATCGAAAAPCATIAHGLERVSAGGTVLVHAGTYQENWLALKNNTTLLSADGPLAARIYSGTFSAVRFEGVHDATLDGFEVYGNWNQGDAGDGLVRVLNASNITVRNSVLHDAPFDQDVVKVSGNVAGLLLENLVVYNPGQRATHDPDCVNSICFQENIDIYGSDGALGAAPPASDIIVRGCWLFHTAEHGGDWLIYSKINAQNVLYENNIFGPSAGLGWVNPAVGIGTSEGGEPDDTAFVVQHAIVRNNVFVGLRGEAAFGVQNSNDVWVYNNTFYGNGGANLRSLIELRGNSHRLGSISIFGNVFAANQPTMTGATFYRLRDELPTSFFHDYNLYFDTIATSDTPYSGEAHSLYNANPLLSAPAVPSSAAATLSRIPQLAATFAPGTGSPALTHGLDAIARAGHPNWKPGQTDRRWSITGHPRPSTNTWDLGAAQR